MYTGATRDVACTSSCWAPADTAVLALTTAMDASGAGSETRSLYARLRAACAPQWRAYCDHEFVAKLGTGTLGEACFRHYLEQDYLFLIHFSRAWALAVYKSQSVTDMRAAAAMLDAILNTEMDLHVRYCESFGISRAELEGRHECKATMAYTRYVLERGLAGDVLDLHVALAPCIVGYAEIGARLNREHAATLPDNPYREWVEMYAGDEYQQVAANAIHHLDELERARGAGARFAELARTFREATVLEADFWTMGLTLSD